jgi:hypothetical protein
MHFDFRGLGCDERALGEATGQSAEAPRQISDPAILASYGAFAVFTGCTVWSWEALGEDVAVPSLPAGALASAARRFLEPAHVSYWAGTERVMDGELALVGPRPFDARGLLPAPDDHPVTTTYLRGDVSARSRARASELAELSSLHELRSGGVLGVTFRVDAREVTALQATASFAQPLPESSWLVARAGVGAYAPFASVGEVAAELRSDRSKALGYTLGVDASTWTVDRRRVLSVAGVVARIAPTVALEERVDVGGWIGPGVDGELALRSTSAALQTLGPRTALYERVTLARGALASTSDPPAPGSALSVDVSLGARRMLGRTWGLALEIDEGGQEGTYRRGGAAVTLYGTLF